MMKNYRVILSILCLFGMDVLAASETYVREFWAPRMHGKRLSYCLSNHTLCGKPVADRYCRLLGYDQAQRISIDYNVGVARYLDVDVLCEGWECNGFKLLSCGAKTLHQPPRIYHYRQQIFALPRYRHYRLDWCYENGQGCGIRAADSFCRRMGFSKAVHFHQDRDIEATRALGNQRLCFGRHCSSFSSITCYR